MSDFLAFRTLISVGLIKIAYVIGAIVITAIGLVGLFALFQERYLTSEARALGVLLNLGVIVGGNIVWRVFCEWLILFFSIHEILASIEQRLQAFANAQDLRAMLRHLEEDLKKGLTQQDTRDLLIAIENRLHSFPTTANLSELLKPLDQGIKGMVKELASMRAGPQGVASKEFSSPPSVESTQPEPPSEMQTTLVAPSEERPATRRQLVLWLIVVLLLLALEALIIIPIASGYAKLEQLDWQSVGNFIKSIFEYWVQRK